MLQSYNKFYSNEKDMVVENRFNCCRHVERAARKIETFVVDQLNDPGYAEHPKVMTDSDIFSDM